MQTRKESKIMQYIGIIIAALGLIYGGIRDYQNGTIKIPQFIQTTKTAQKSQTTYPLQYCQMCYDPNLDKVYYLHENGVWYDFPPAQKKIGEYYH